MKEIPIWEKSNSTLEEAAANMIELFDERRGPGRLKKQRCVQSGML